MRPALAFSIGAAAAVAGGVLYGLRPRQSADVPDLADTTETTTGEPEADQSAPLLAPVWSAWDNVAQAVMPSDDGQAERNVWAFLTMIRQAEGTADANGYAALFGHTAGRQRLFSDWSDHPRVASQFVDGAGRRLWTSAAGAYQFMAVSPIPGGGFTKVNTWDRLQRKLELPDFSPASQDAAAVELIREAGALGDVRAGRFDAAVQAVRRIWASMPGAGYSQGERSLESLRLAFVNAGGVLA